MVPLTGNNRVRRQILRIFLLIQALVLGAFHAYSLSAIQEKDVDRSVEFEEMFNALGKTDLVEQKVFLIRTTRWMSLLFVPYCVFSIIYFLGSGFPWVITAGFVTMVVTDYSFSLKKIKLAKTLEEAISVTLLDRIILWVTFVLLAIQVSILL